jgi:hypothetical protein
LAAQPRKPTPPAPRAAKRGTVGTPLTLAENPWLRGVIATPSVSDSLGVTVMGAPNYLALARLMHKPHSSVLNAFTDAAPFGLTTSTFSGEAVAFVPVVTFRTVTARLN